MPDPTNPNTPATTASNPMASAPSWDQFVNQYWQGPTDRTSYVAQSYGAPTFLKPFGQMNGMFGLDLRGMQGVGWDRLVNSGLLGRYGIESPNEWRELTNRYQPNRFNQSERILQEAFRDWQLQQMRQQSQNQQQPTQPTTPPAAPQNQTVTFGTQQTLNDFANTPPVASPLGSYAAALLASMNAAPVATTTPGVQSSPIAAYINYLMGN